MIKFKQIDKTTYKDYKKELTVLYQKTFSQGISAQYINKNETEYFFDTVFEVGFGIYGCENEQIVGFSLFTPLSFDNLMPKEINEKYSDKNSLYIAEVLVDEEFRGQKIAQNLLKEFENSLNKDIKNLILRVFEENLPAISMYEKIGFRKISEIFQTKLKPDGKTEFLMKKIYMIKNL